MQYQPLNQGRISTRTGKNTVAIVGFAKSTRHLVPYEDMETEIWGINDAYHVKGFMKRWDRWFQLHPLSYLAVQDNSPRDAEHIAWLKEPHEFPIYMQKDYPDMPACVEFPLQQVMEKIGRNYLSSSFAFMFGLAMLEGFKRIEIYGFDMATFSEYASQRPNTEYLIGLAEGRGIDVYIPNQSNLCRGPIYGYEDLDISLRQEMEYLQQSLEANIKTQSEQFHYLDGRAKLLVELSKKYPELKGRARKVSREARMKVDEINNTMGREQMTRELMGMHDELKNKELKLKESSL